MGELVAIPISLPHDASRALGIGPRRGLLIRGRGGRLGEASPLPGRSIDTIEDVLAAIATGRSTPSLDFARWAIATPRTHGSVTSQVLLDDPREVVGRAESTRAQAYKLKLRPADDLGVLSALRRAAPHAKIRVDANRSFARPSEVPWDALAAAGVEWIEEPCAGLDARLDAPVPIALDETLLDDPEGARALLRAQRVAAVVLKPTLLGAERCLALADEARALGVRAIVSHAFESEVGRQAAEELARRIAPREVHGLAPFAGIDAFGTDGGVSVSALLEEELRAHPPLV